MYTLKWIINESQSLKTEIDGKLIPARPIGSDNWCNRIKDAFAVLLGKADAFTWPSNQ